MKPLIRCFGMLLRQIARDSMLYAVLLAPLLAGCIFRFGIPMLEAMLCEYFGRAAVLAGYYLLFDMVLAVMTPYMICFISALVMLTEYDENVAGYIAVTPIRKRGYILSRLVFPAVFSVIVSPVVIHFFSLTAWSLPALLLMCGLAGLLGVALALLIVAFSHNRVEGMALAKLSGAVVLGLPVPFFLSSGVQYLFAPLPSFWMAKVFTNGNFLDVVPAVLVSLLWIWALYGKFERKLL